MNKYKYRLRKNTPKWQIPIRVLVVTICLPPVGLYYTIKNTILGGVPDGWDTVCKSTSSYIELMRDAWSINYWREWYEL